ncbi:hypothetical protein PCASD_22929 [Puccinia coronata f. sp. avenae]|uniref:BolA protein n=2 Tax=Puccinia coronata f. sp. avenae TaxID=200324 RepID=A0A2N5S823_9BASI|nr:hypothetical protein PCASD_22929 [Puccinia coronata f. sp. avenae]
MSARRIGVETLVLGALRRRPQSGTLRNLLALTMSASSSTGKTIGPIETSMREKLTAQLNPSVLDIANDSHLHRHHAAMKSIGGGSGETHFSVRVVSENLKTLTPEELETH